MNTLVAAPIGIELPSVGFTPSAYSLVSAALVNDRPDGQWAFSGAFRSQAGLYPRALFGTDFCATTPAKHLDTGMWQATVQFALYSFWRCSTAGVTQAELQAEAQARFTAGESRGLEAALWALFAQTPLSTVTGAADALGTAEAVVGWSFGGEGVIHVGHRVASTLAAANLLGPQGQQQRTVAARNRVVVGDGYAAASLTAINTSDFADASTAFSYAADASTPLKINVTGANGIVINWGDDTATTTIAAGVATHTYAAAGLYPVTATAGASTNVVGVPVSAATTPLIVASGPVSLTRGPITVSPAVDRNVNDVQVLVERMYQLAIEPPVVRIAIA